MLSTNYMLFFLDPQSRPEDKFQ